MSHRFNDSDSFKALVHEDRPHPFRSPLAIAVIFAVGYAFGGLFLLWSGASFVSALLLGISAILFLVILFLWAVGLRRKGMLERWLKESDPTIFFVYSPSQYEQVVQEQALYKIDEDWKYLLALPVLLFGLPGCLVALASDRYRMYTAAGSVAFGLLTGLLALVGALADRRMRRAGKGSLFCRAVALNGQGLLFSGGFMPIDRIRCVELAGRNRPYLLVNVRTRAFEGFRYQLTDYVLKIPVPKDLVPALSRALRSLGD